MCGLILLVAIGTAFTIWRRHETSQFEAVLRAYEDGQFALEAGQAEAAIDYFQAAKQQAPDYARASIGLAEAQFNLGNLEQAMQSISTAIDLLPFDPENVLSPAEEPTEDAIALRIEIAKALGDQSQVEADEAQLAKTGFLDLDIFKGLLRFW